MAAAHGTSTASSSTSATTAPAAVASAPSPSPSSLRSPSPSPPPPAFSFSPPAPSFSASYVRVPPRAVSRASASPSSVRQVSLVCTQVLSLDSLKGNKAIGDVDNDSNNEVVVGSINGNLQIFKSTTLKARDRKDNKTATATAPQSELSLWRCSSDLGTITCVAIGAIRNGGSNSLVVIAGEGKCHIFDFASSQSQAQSQSPASPHSQSQSQSQSQFRTSTMDHQDTTAESARNIQPSMSLRVPLNICALVIADVDNNSRNELVIGTRDRTLHVLELYCRSGPDHSAKWSLRPKHKVSLSSQVCSIGTTALHLLPAEVQRALNKRSVSKSSDALNVRTVVTKNGPSVSVSSASKPEPSLSRNQASLKNHNNKSTGKAKPNQQSRAHISKRPSVILVGMERGLMIVCLSINAHKQICRTSMMWPLRDNNLRVQVDSYHRNDMRNKREYASQLVELSGFAVGTALGGIFMHIRSSTPRTTTVAASTTTKHAADNKSVCVQSRSQRHAHRLCSSSVQLNGRILSLSTFPFNGDGVVGTIACLWDGGTYFMHASLPLTRFEFPDRVCAFRAGMCSVVPGYPVPCLVYVNFKKQLVLYSNITVHGGVDRHGSCIPVCNFLQYFGETNLQRLAQIGHKQQVSSRQVNNTTVPSSHTQHPRARARAYARATTTSSSSVSPNHDRLVSMVRALQQVDIRLLEEYCARLVKKVEQCKQLNPKKKHKHIPPKC